MTVNNEQQETFDFSVTQMTEHVQMIGKHLFSPDIFQKFINKRW
jgi:hypothetical protein